MGPPSPSEDPYLLSNSEHRRSCAATHLLFFARHSCRRSAVPMVVTSLFRGGQHCTTSLGREGRWEGVEGWADPKPIHIICYSLPQHLVSHVPLDQEGQMAGDRQEEANGLIREQEGEQPSHQNFPFPHRQHLQKVICCLPVRERGECLESCARKGSFTPAARPRPAGPSLLRLRWDCFTHSRLLCSWVFKA